MDWVTENDIQNCTYYFFDDIMKTKHLDRNKIKINKKSPKNIPIYYVCYMKPDIVKTLFIIINNANGYIEGSNGNKHLALVPNAESKGELKKYEEIKNLVISTNNNADDYDKKYMKIQFNADDEKKALKVYGIIIVARSVFNDGNKYYPQVFLDDCLYKLTG